MVDIKDKYEFKDLVEIIALLRSENGCPWDREQTHKSLKANLIEETYEVLDAIDLGDKDKICEELGDVLLQVVFHAQLSSEEGNFSINGVISKLCSKMIQRHPHVFGKIRLETSNEVLYNWEVIKKKEKKVLSHTDLLKDIPSNLPALMRSYRSKLGQLL